MFCKMKNRGTIKSEKMISSVLVDKIMSTEKSSVNQIFEDKGKVYSFLNPVSYLTALDNKELFGRLDGLFADGGLMSTKPYISGSNYLKKMSDYSTENWGEIWDSLFWNFIAKNQEFFRKNPRLSMMLITWNKMTEQQKELHLVRAQNFLEKLDQ